MDRLLVRRGRSGSRNSASSNAGLDGRDRHHEREALGISFRLFTTTCLSFAICSSLFAFDSLRTVDIVGIQGFVFFLKSRDGLNVRMPKMEQGN